jgi:hypothetical protein
VGGGEGEVTVGVAIDGGEALVGGGVEERKGKLCSHCSRPLGTSFINHRHVMFGVLFCTHNLLCLLCVHNCNNLATYFCRGWELFHLLNKNNP